MNPNPFALATQTRESFPAVKDTTLGNVQVADELGFAYLDGDIDFGAIGRNEIFQNIKYIILTEYFSVPLDREFGFDYSVVDKPMHIAEAIISQEVAMKISMYEPRAQFREINFVRHVIEGKLDPSVRVVLLTTNESPSMYAAISGAGEVIPAVTKATIAAGIYFTGKITGLQGPQGPPGPSSTITVGETTTGEPGTDAIVVDVGDPVNAILEFTIPRGDKGEQGTGITIKGTVPNYNSLPTTGNQPGDLWIASDTGHGWSWDGTQWVDTGPIQGPPGTAATINVGQTTTGDPGTPANVTNVGTSNNAVFDFTIPEGIQGEHGKPGQIWRGQWDSATNYVIDDAVEFEGSTYICTGNNINTPPDIEEAAVWMPPLANTANRGTVPPLPPSNQTHYYARGDNTWQLFADAIPVPVGSIVQSMGWQAARGQTSAIVTPQYNMPATTGFTVLTAVFTPKYPNSILRISFYGTISTTSVSTCGLGVFKDSDTTALSEAWQYQGVANGVGVNAGGAVVTLSSGAPVTLLLKMGGNIAGTRNLITGGFLSVDEIKQ